MLTINEVAPGLIACEFDTQEEMTRTFVRIEEFYEHPFFANKVFSVEDFLAYDKNHHFDENGDYIDYFTYWEGFNVPGKNYLAFREKFDSFSWEEHHLDQMLLPYVLENSYLLAYVKGDTVTLWHELSHAYFTQDANYRLIAESIIKPNRHRLQFIIDALQDDGYDEEHIEDELMAYISVDRKCLLEDYDCPTTDLADIYEPLEALFHLKDSQRTGGNHERS